MRLVLLGDPVAHSRSPAIHAAALAAAGIAGRYEARRVDADGVYRACAEIRSGALAGANVTMPHKQVAAAAADWCAPTAARCGAVNTLVARDGEVAGHNTDVSGVRMLLERMALPADAGVLVLGAGGAAAAALVACEGRPLRLSARNPAAAAALAAAVAVDAGVAPWGAPVPGALVINSTPLGMAGEHLPPGIVGAASGVLEMAYGSGVTPAVAEASRRGLDVADGIDLLVAQAAGSFTLWTGRPAPLEIMEAAARG